MPVTRAEGPLVLIADDDPLNRNLMRAFLERAGYRVLEAPDGARAVALARAESPRLVILDARMQTMDGFAACAALRADARTAGIPVILFSAQDDEQQHQLAREAGADDYLYKLMDWAEILERVAARLGRQPDRR